MLALHTDNNRRRDGVKPPKKFGLIGLVLVMAALFALPAAGLASPAKPVVQSSPGLNVQTLQSAKFKVAKKSTVICLAPFTLADGSRSGALLFNKPRDKTTRRALRAKPVTRKVYGFLVTSSKVKVPPNTYRVKSLGSTYVRLGSGGATDCSGGTGAGSGGVVVSPGDGIDGDGEAVDGNNDGQVSAQTPDGSMLTVSCLDDTGVQEIRSLFVPSRPMNIRAAFLVTGPGDVILMPGQATFDQFVPVSAPVNLLPVVYNGTANARVQVTLDLGGIYPRMKVDARSMCDGDEGGGGSSSGGVPPEELDP
jgi:hypothetical protein